MGYSRGFQTKLYNRAVQAGLVPAPSVAAVAEATGAPKLKRKYGNKRVVVADGSFDSQGEERRYRQLQMLARARAISGLERQVTYKFEVNGVHVGEGRFDFRYVEDGRLVVEDFKGYRNPADPVTKLFNMKCRLMEACHGIQVLVST